MNKPSSPLLELLSKQGKIAPDLLEKAYQITGVPKQKTFLARFSEERAKLIDRLFAEVMEPHPVRPVSTPPPSALPSRELSPYLKGLVGEGLLRSEEARVFATGLSTDQEYRAAYKELLAIQEDTAHYAALKTRILWRPRDPELGKDAWRVFHGLQTIGKHACGLICLPFMFFCGIANAIQPLRWIILLPFRAWDRLSFKGKFAVVIVLIALFLFRGALAQLIGDLISR